MWIDTKLQKKLKEEELLAVSSRDWEKALLIHIGFFRNYNKTEDLDKTIINNYLQQMGEEYVAYLPYILSVFKIGERITYRDLSIDAIYAFIELVSEYCSFFYDEKNYNILFSFMNDCIEDFTDYIEARTEECTAEYIEEAEYIILFITAKRAEIEFDLNKKEKAYETANQVLCKIEENRIEYFFYSYIMAASVIASQLLDIGDDSQAYILLKNAEVLLEKTKDNQSFYEQYRFRVNASLLQYYLNSGDQKRQEEYALANYNATEDMIRGIYEYLVAAGGLSLVYIFSGRTDEAMIILNKAVIVIRENRYEKTEVAIRIFQIKLSIHDTLIERLKLRINKKNSFKNEKLKDFSQIYIQIESCIDILKRKSCGIIKTKLIAVELKQLASLIEQRYSNNDNAAIELLIGQVYIARNLRQQKKLKQYVVEALNLADDMEGMGRYDNYSRVFLRVFYYSANLFSDEEVLIIVEKLIQGMCFRYNYILNLREENIVLKALWQNMNIIKSIVLLVEQNKMKISDEKFIELIENGKNMYLSLLRNRRWIKEDVGKEFKKYEAIMSVEKEQIHNYLAAYFFGKPISEDIAETEYREKRQLYNKLDQLANNYEWQQLKNIFENINHAICLVFTSYPKVFDKEPRLMDMRYSLVKVTKDGNLMHIERFSNINLYFVRVGIALLDMTMRATKENRVVDFLRKTGHDIISKLILGKIDLNSKSTIDKIYVNSDFDIHRLPLCYLKITETQRIIDRYNLIYCDSIIDISEKDFSISTKNALVIGNPEFNVHDTNKNMSFQKAEMEVFALPISKVEAGIVAEKLGVKPVLRHDATKDTVFFAKADIIHIATHGFCLNSEMDEPVQKIPELICSSVLLSGVNDWLKTGIIDPVFGNGILTAKEIVMSTTLRPKLVVLSSCFGASGVRTTNSGMIGMATAFKAIGAKAIIGNLWEVDDLAVAILMERFYSVLENGSPVKALRDAQIYIRDLTVQEMNQNKWFDITKLRRMGSNAEEVLKLKEKPDDYKPFHNPKYWSGFICEY